MSGRRFHTDTRASENFTKDGLETLTGQASHYWGRYVVKELVDNALEAVEGSNTDAPAVSVSLDIGGGPAAEHVREVTVTDNGLGIPEERLEKVVDIEAFGGTKRHYCLPTRGTQGNALMTILGIQHLADGGPLCIETRGTRYEFPIDGGTIDGTPRVEIEETPAAAADGGATTGTSVTVEFGDKGREWARDRAIYTTLLGFVALNPHIGFDVELSTEEGPAAERDTSTRYEPKGSATTGRALWFDRQAFEERVKADLRAEPQLSVGEFVGEFDGLASRDKRRSVLSRLDIAASDRLDEVVAVGDALDTATVHELHQAMQAETAPRSPDNLDATLGSVGEALRAGPKAYLDRHDIADVERLAEDLSADGADVSGWRDLTIYYKTSDAVDAGDHRIPLVFELAALPLRADIGTRLTFGINQSVAYSPPNASIEVKRTGKQEPEQYGSIENAFRDLKHAFVVTCNLTCPNIPFKDKGKQSFPTAPFEDAIGDVVGRAIRKYERDLRPLLNRLDEDNTAAPPELPNKAPHGFVKDTVFGLFERVYNDATEGGEYTITMRQLFYKMRPEFQAHADRHGYEYKSTATVEHPRPLELNYDTFTGYVDEYEQDILGDRVVHRDDRGFFLSRFEYLKLDGEFSRVSPRNKLRSRCSDCNRN